MVTAFSREQSTQTDTTARQMRSTECLKLNLVITAANPLSKFMVQDMSTNFVILELVIQYSYAFSRTLQAPHSVCHNAQKLRTTYVLGSLDSTTAVKHIFSPSTTSFITKTDYLLIVLPQRLTLDVHYPTSQRLRLCELALLKEKMHEAVHIVRVLQAIPPVVLLRPHAVARVHQFRLV